MNAPSFAPGVLVKGSKGDIHTNWLGFGAPKPLVIWAQLHATSVCLPPAQMDAIEDVGLSAQPALILGDVNRRACVRQASKSSPLNNGDKRSRDYNNFRAFFRPISAVWSWRSSCRRDCDDGSDHEQVDRAVSDGECVRVKLARCLRRIANGRCRTESRVTRHVVR